MDEPNVNKHASLECASTPGRFWPGASLYKSLKLGWQWRRLRWAVVAASEAAQGHEANGLSPGRVNSKHSLTRSPARFRSIPVNLASLLTLSRHGYLHSVLWSGWPIPLSLCLGTRLG